MDNKDFRRHGHEFVDWLADYFDHIEDYPVRSRAKPGDISEKLAECAPYSGESMEVIFEDFKRIVMPGISHWQHPGWFAYFPANNSPASVLAEMLTAGLGVQGMIWQTSPAAAELEETMMKWLGKMLSLPEYMEGVIQDTASTATLCALLSAREKATGFASNASGAKWPLKIYASAETHSSILKGAMIAGFGKDNLSLIDTGQNFAMMPEALEKAIEDDLAKGHKPTCVVATLGTTSSMAMDPLEAIGAICQKYDIWMHVDAAFAGTAAVSPAHRWFMKGIELADSFVFNPHKWMLTNFDCSAYFVKDSRQLVNTFSVQPEYLKTSADDKVKNYRDWGIQLGRRFRALKLWFVLRSYGVEGIRQMVEKHIDLAIWFAQVVNKASDFELMAPQCLSLVCFRYNPGNLSEKEVKSINEKLLEKVNDSGAVYLTHTVLKGQYSLRLSVGQRTTEKSHVEKAWQLLNQAAQTL